ncbi:MAG TPA: hypothetical protein VFG33_34060 [Kribbella sp.]|uniref:hypothetical protein n=1 Tax=Kribbella sp. TaxID=1871183 RepID=UPI002D76A7CA|nr:hypothetical protein [Kribbella sp.]HET6298448.1 hypothetical protein [Kribbella sp.]
MRARQLLPIALVALLALTGCANSGGLRVEGAEVPSTPATPSDKPSTNFAGPDQRKPATPTTPVTPVTVSLAQVRLSLLADKNLEGFFRVVLAKCTVIDRCLSRGPTVNVMRSAAPQLVVMIHTVDSFVYGAVLMELEPSGPRRIWGVKADKLKVNPGQQGDLVVESGIFQGDDPVCCPSVTRVEVYRWNGRQMIKVSSRDQKGD